jgi:AraC-like DNA-binding protein
VERAASIDSFVANPIGRYFAGPTYFICGWSHTLCGSAHWGRPSESDARDLTRLFDLARHPDLAGGFTVYMDSRALEPLEWAAVSIILEYVRSRLPEWGRVITKQAVLVADGPAGALVAGMAPLAGLTYPMRFFTAPEEARRWLDHPEVPQALAAIEPLVDAERGVSPVLRALRRYLERSLEGATIDAAAHEAGLSPRSLQRELRSHQTSFSAELGAARIRIACQLLTFGDDKIEIIARRVGCATSSHLSRFFRRAVGETPAEYRARTKPPTI